MLNHHMQLVDALLTARPRNICSAVESSIGQHCSGSQRGVVKRDFYFLKKIASSTHSDNEQSLGYCTMCGKLKYSVRVLMDRM